MLFRLKLLVITALPLLAAPAVAQEVLPAPAPPASCSAGKLSTDMASFVGPEDADAAPSQVAASVEGEASAAVGSLPARIEKPTRRAYMTADEAALRRRSTGGAR
jgi:hypothetical protein